MLDGLANQHKQLEPLVRRQMILVAILRDGNSPHQFHHEIGPARLGRAGVEHFGDVGMVHQRERLAFGFEPRDHLPGVHAQFDDLERDTALQRLALFGHINGAETALADLLEQLVVVDHSAGAFGELDWRNDGRDFLGKIGVRGAGCRSSTRPGLRLRNEGQPAETGRAKPFERDA